MPVPESSYSRRYGREDSTAYTSSYSRSTSSSNTLTGGRSSYLSYSSKGTSTLPPRPPATYEYRKYTDSNIGSRFLSSSASRVGGGREYGSSNYRSSVSPVRASASSIRRQLEATAPTIAERIKAMELGESEQEAATPVPTRISRLSNLRSRDGPRSTASSYSRDRSGSREYGSGIPLISSSSLSRGDSNKSSTENLRNRDRSSPAPSSTSGALSRSGSGSGVGMRNGVSSRFGSIEVNSENATSSASKGVGVTVAANTTTTTTTTIKPKTGSVNDDSLNVDKCVKKDVDNNDSDSVGSSSSASSSLSANSSPDKGIIMNGFSYNNMNNSEDVVPAPTVGRAGGEGEGDSSIAKKPNNSNVLPSAASGTQQHNVPPTKVVSAGFVEDSGEGGEKDSNGNPITISITTVPPSGVENNVDKGIISVDDNCSPEVVVSPEGVNAKDFSGPLLKKCVSDNNANNLQESPQCNGESSALKEKSPFDAVLNYSPTKSNSAKIAPSVSRKSFKSSPKVIYHTIQVEEEARNSVSPEPVYTLTSRPSLDGTGPKIELKNVTKSKKASSPASVVPLSSESVSAEFKVTLPKLKSATTTATSSEYVHNNKTVINSGEEDAEELTPNKLISIVDVDGMNGTPARKSETKESSPKLNSTPTLSSKEGSPPTLVSKSSRSPTPDKQGKANTNTKGNVANKRSSKSRENTPTLVSTSAVSIPTKEKSPSPPIVATSTGEKNYSEVKTNGEIHLDNINNTADSMGPHSSKYTHTSYNGTQRDSSNRNERFGRSYGGSHLAVTNASDSSDNDSDTVTSSPHSSGSGRFRANKDSAGLVGLRNIGNTCFMNTVLQCLSNTRPLLEYVMSNYESDINRSTSGMKGALMRAFGSLIHELWQDHRVVDTSAFKDSIQRFAPRFMGYSQQDAQEFLRYLLEGLHEDVNRVTTKPTPITTDIEDALNDADRAIESWRRYMRYESSRIVDMFVGQFKSTLKCTVCGHSSVTFDPFWDLSLPIPSRSSTVRLSQCFELLTKEEVLDGDEKPTCAKCQCRRKCTKSLSIQKFPKILVVHLKRFSLAERYRGKLSTLVEYPLNGLDLTQFAATTGNVGAYNLYGVANHSGSTYSGHYIAYCKHPYSNEWHCYNDSRVSSISPHSVVSSEGYVLFYEQVGQSSQL